MEKSLNQLLADFVAVYHKLQNFHWYVEGKDFFTAHAKLEELYDHINDGVDEIAETILMIEGKPLGSMKSFLNQTKIEEASEKAISSKEIYKSVLNDFEYLLQEVKDIKKEADENNVYVVSVLMDDFIKEFTKSIWMISKTVKA